MNNLFRPISEDTNTPSVCLPWLFLEECRDRQFAGAGEQCQGQTPAPDVSQPAQWGAGHGLFQHKPQLLLHPDHRGSVGWPVYIFSTSGRLKISNATPTSPHTPYSCWLCFTLCCELLKPHCRFLSSLRWYLCGWKPKGCVYKQRHWVKDRCWVKNRADSCAALASSVPWYTQDSWRSCSLCHVPAVPSRFKPFPNWNFQQSQRPYAPRGTKCQAEWFC